MLYFIGMVKVNQSRPLKKIDLLRFLILRNSLFKRVFYPTLLEDY